MIFEIPCFLKLRVTVDKPKTSPRCTDGGKHDYLRMYHFVAVHFVTDPVTGKSHRKRAYRTKYKCLLCGQEKVKDRKKVNGKYK